MEQITDSVKLLGEGLISHDLAEHIKREADAFDSVERIAMEFAQAGTPIAHIGDGNCGYLIARIKAALECAGIYDPTPKIKKADYQKKVIPGQVRKSVFERDQYRCVHCGTHIDLTVDHVIPERKGGTLALENLQTLCRPCNSKKGVA